MSASTVRRSAAALALRWHAGTGALVALTAALTLAGTLPALAMLGGTAAAPALTLALGDVPALLADWGGRGIVWPQLQQLAIQQLTGIVRGAVLLTLTVGAATLLALHLARTASRSGEVIVARAVGAARRDIFGAMLLEAAALAGVALSIGTVCALIASTVMRATWPGTTGHANIALIVAGTLAVTALVMVAPLLLVRALSTTRLVDDDRRPLTLIIPALQLGAAVVVLAGGVQLRSVTSRAQSLLTDASLRTTMVQDLRASDTDRLLRAQRFAAFLDARHAASPGTLVSLGSNGFHRGLGTSANVTSDCGARCDDGVIVRGSTETVVHHVVSGDTFALAGTSLLRGRTISDRDRWDAPLVAMVNATMARAMFPNGDAVGRRLQLPMLGNRWFDVIGIVADAPARGLGSAVQPPLAVYVSVLQHPVAMIEVATVLQPLPSDALRTLGTFGTLTRATVSVRTQLTRDIDALQWFSRVLLAMGVTTAIIAVGGLIAMLQLWLDSQQRELGVRRAVGATRGAIHRLVLGRAALVAVGGSLFGAWMGQIAWDVLPRIVPGAPMFDRGVVFVTAVALATLTLAVAFVMSHRFTRTPVGTLLIDVG